MSVDLTIMGDPRQPRATLSLTGKYIAGTNKLAQRVLVLLLSSRSSAYNLGLGTDLLNQVTGANAVLDQGTLKNQLNIAVQAVKAILQTDLASLPPEERLADLQATLVAGDANDTLQITLTVVSQAGTNYVITLPTSATLSTQV